MSDEKKIELTDEEQGRLERLARRREPSAGLEDRVVAALRSEGLLKTDRPGNPWLRSASLLAASVAMLLVGYLIGRSGPPSPVSGEDPSRAASRFMLLLYETEDDHRRPDQAGLEKQAEEYRAWGNGLGKRGLLASGEPLRIGGAMIRPAGEETIFPEAPPRVPADLVLGGYFMIYADTLEEAVRIAESSPHLSYNGTIVVRQVGFGEVERAADGS